MYTNIHTLKYANIYTYTHTYIHIYINVNTVAYLGFHFGGGGRFKIFLQKWVYLHGAKLGGLGACSPEKKFKNGAIWCVLENSLLKFCKKRIVKIFIFYIKIIDNVLLRTKYLGVLEHTP